MPSSAPGGTAPDEAPRDQGLSPEAPASEAVLVPLSFDDDILSGDSQGNALLLPSARFRRLDPHYFADLRSGNPGQAVILGRHPSSHATYLSKFHDVHLTWSHCLFLGNEFHTYYIGQSRAIAEMITGDWLSPADLAMTGMTRTDDGIAVSQTRLDSAIRIHERVLLSTPDVPSNLELWLHAAIPATAYFLQNRDKFDKFMSFLYCKFQWDMLELLGIDRADVLLQDCSQPYVFEDLTCLRRTSRDNWILPDELEQFQWVAAKVLALHGPTGKPNIFLGRNGPGDSGLNAAMAKLGFDIVVPETLSAVERIRTFASAKFIAGFGGDRMVYAAFCAPGTKIIDIETSLQACDRNNEIFSSAKLAHAFVLADPDTPDQAHLAHGWFAGISHFGLRNLDTTPGSTAGKPSAIPAPPAFRTAGGTIPRNIYLMWDKPRELWPKLVTTCIDLWVEINPDFNVEVFDIGKARDLIAGDIDPGIFDTLKPQHQSDLVRTKLLSTVGGVWADASCLPHMPVRDWIGKFDDLDFAGLPTHQPGQICDNWFMISRKSGYLLSLQYEALVTYWQTPKLNLPQDDRSIRMIGERWEHFISDFAAHDLRIAPYFLWHYLFRQLYDSNGLFRECFDQQKFLSTDGGCGALIRMLQQNRASGIANNPMPDAMRQLLATTAAPLSKLNHHSTDLNYPLDDFRRVVLERLRAAAG